MGRRSAPVDLGARVAAASISRVAPPRRRDLVVYSSFAGRFSDHPRAIFAEHVRRSPHRYLWVADGSWPGSSAGVAPRTPGHVRALDAARVVVTNSHLPRWYRPRSHTLVLQTWHGTPLKKIGFDLPRTGGRYDRYLRHLEREVPSWGLLLSSSPYVTQVFREAFHYDGPVLESGSPRNDRLVSASPDERQWLRHRLGVREDERLLLYAPTFRDDGSVDWFRRTVEALGRGLPTEWKVMYRSHPNHPAPGAQAQDRVLDVTSEPDIVDLFIAADALVTDYSSTMFDFLLTGRPVYRYAPDLATYRDELRGFYVDVDELPVGPVVSSVDDLVSLVAAGPEGLPPERLREFRERFAPWDDGRASSRVVTELLRRSAPGSSTGEPPAEGSV